MNGLLVLGVLLLPLAAAPATALALAVALLRGFVVFLWAVCTGDTSGRDADAEWGRTRTQGVQHARAHLQPPAPGRRGWVRLRERRR